MALIMQQKASVDRFDVYFGLDLYRSVKELCVKKRKTGTLRLSSLIMITTIIIIIIIIIMIMIIKTYLYRIAESVLRKKLLSMQVLCKK